MTRVHRKCGGRGFIVRASGAEGYCFGCNGTGYYTRPTQEQLDAYSGWRRAYSAMLRIPRTFTVDGVRPMEFRSGALAGLELLAQLEPGRLPKLYDAVDRGLLAEVTTHLYRYGTNIQRAYESLYCDTCHKDGLWISLRCNRPGAYFADNGAEQPEGTASRYEGTCIKCCGHNHG